MFLRKLLFSIALTFVGSHSIYLQAQSQDPIRFNHIQNGMAQSSATLLFEDSLGFIWVGTQNGLNKYDGTDFELFEKTQDGKIGLTNAFIEYLYEDGEDLLIGTNQGLSVYDRSLERVTPYPFKNGAKEMESKNIKAIAKTGNTLWMGTAHNGLYAYNIETGLLRRLPSNSESKTKFQLHTNILGIFPLNDERLLVVSKFNAVVIDQNLNTLKAFPFQEEMTKVQRVDAMTFIAGTSNGELITLNIGTALELSIEKKAISPGYAILSLAKDKEGAIWIGTENNGLFIYSKKDGSLTQHKNNLSRPSSLPNNSIWSMLSARNGVMWLAPFKNGISFYDSKFHKFEHISPDPFDSLSLNNKLVNAFSEDAEGNLYIGTDGGGLNYWNRSTGDFDFYSEDNEKFGANVILSILQTKKNELWVGSWGRGITIFNTETKAFEQLNTENSGLQSDFISDMVKDKNGRIWLIHFYKGVQIYHPDTKSFTDVPLLSEHDGTEVVSAYTVFEDKAGMIWVGTLNAGLFRFKAKDKGWETRHYHNIDRNGSLSDDFVNTIVQDEGGRIWVGTKGGLNKYYPESDTFMSITKADGLTNDAIQSIVAEGDRHLWLGTVQGIAKYDIETGAVVDYTMDDGLQSNEFNARSVFKTKSGELLFGGGNGFNIFRPESVVKRDDNPRLFISGIKIFNKPVLPNDEWSILKKDISQVDSITLNYTHSVVNFNFKTLTYRHPEKVNYAYFLEGFETEWNYVGNNPGATYTNLNPGQYTLRIKSSNSDGIWGDNEISLAIRITPPFWQTWWFRALLILSILAIIYLLYALRVRSIKRDRIQLERQVNERTQELRTQKKILANVADELSVKNDEIQRFTYAVSHDLKSPLNSIQIMAGLVEADIEAGETEDVAQSLEYITQSCTIMNTLIADITEIAKLGEIKNRMELLDTNDIIKVASSMAIGRFIEKNAELIVADNLPKIYGDRNRFIQIFENLIDNAIKYMGDQKKPLIEIKARGGRDTQQFLVIDNGSGMDETSIKKLFTPFKRFHAETEGAGLGLYMVKKIVASHDGTITAESEGKDKGTTFIVTLPKAEIAVQQEKARKKTMEAL